MGKATIVRMQVRDSDMGHASVSVLLFRNLVCITLE